LMGETGSIAKGGLDSVILLVERDNDDKITGFAAVQVDGKKIKANTFYKLKKGKLEKGKLKKGKFIEVID